MESNTSDYRKRLHLLLDKLSSEVDKVNSHVDYPKLLNSNNSEQLAEILKELDSRIASVDSNFSQPGNWSELTTDPLSLFHEVINGYAVLAISAIGLILNILGIYFLSSGTRRGKILSLMVASLLSFDATYLSFQILKCVESWTMFIPRKYFKAHLIFIYSVMRSSLISSIFMLVAIARVRLCAIRKPFQHNNAILTWGDRRNFCLRYLIPIVISSMVLTSPLFCEIDDTPAKTNKADPLVTPTSLRLHPIYSVLYIGVLNLGILGLIPIAYLICLAYQIKMELKQNKKRRERLGSYHSNQESNIEEMSEVNTTRGLVTIILVFVACHAFRILIAVGELCILLDPNKDDAILQSGGGVPVWFDISLSLNNLLLVINASVNVVIYLKPNSKEVLNSLMPTRAGHVNELTLKQEGIEDVIIDVKKEKNEENDKNRCENKQVASKLCILSSPKDHIGRRKSISFEETSLSASENDIKWRKMSESTIKRRSSTWAIVEEV